MYGNLKGQSKKSQFGARSVTLLTAAPSNKINSCAGIFKQSMKVVVPARKATQPGGIGSLESILGFFKVKNSDSGFSPHYNDKRSLKGTVSRVCRKKKELEKAKVAHAK
jgi:hypothetical protein